jgi:UDP-2,4-diacetamido-2,4,6-trideoxy-beta-L-altropyranose hydrolase
VKSVLIRCDGSDAIGLGHVSRTLSLALALQDRNVPVLFAMRPFDGIAERVEKAGFPVARLPVDGGPQLPLRADDLPGLRAAAAASGADVVVVDHYGAPEEYLIGIKRAGLGLAVIDDLADRDLSAADWLLNQNLGAEQLTTRHRPNAVVLLGPSYALVRPEFATAREGLRRSFGAADNRVLVTLGGGSMADKLELVERRLEAVTRPLDVRLLARRSAQTPPESRHTWRVVEDPPDVAPHMAWADVSVNAGGSTCWELASLGVPMAVTVLADNQQNIADQLVAHGCAVGVGAANFTDLPAAIQELLESPARRRALSSAAAELVDGRGAARVAESLIGTFAGGVA